MLHPSRPTYGNGSIRTSYSYGTRLQAPKLVPDSLHFSMSRRRNSGPMMNTAKRFSLLVDLVLLAASFAQGGPVAEQVRTIGVLVAAVVGALAVFCAVVLAIGVCAQRKPPYPI
jgi:hypothetical protein